MKNEKSATKEFCGIDIVKFLCALLVISLHLIGYAFSNMAVDGKVPTGSGNLTMLFISPLYFSIARVAVPFFFISSSYFLFKKIKEHPEDRKKIIKQYCFRVLALYSFWLVVSIPVLVDKYMIEAKSRGGENSLPLSF